MNTGNPNKRHNVFFSLTYSLRSLDDKIWLYSFRCFGFALYVGVQVGYFFFRETSLRPREEPGYGIIECAVNDKTL